MSVNQTRDSTCSSINENCILARNGFQPYARCDHCDLHVDSCMGIQSTALIFAISFLALLFLFLHDPWLIRLNILALIAILFWLGYRVMISTDQLASANAQNAQLNRQLNSYNQTLESEVKRRTAQLEKMATQDTLTGLLNRYAFEKRLKASMEETRLSEVEHVLCYMDLDQFKIVNDTCGHVAGDALLRQLSVVLKNSIRTQDVIARLGGDEFGIILSSISVTEAERLAERMLRQIKEFRFLWHGKTFGIGASIGMVGIQQEGSTLASILSKADTACYAAKDQGRNQIHVAGEHDAITQERHDQMQWVSQIESAIKERRLDLFVQPIIALAETSSVHHYELLLRMRTDDGTLIMPMAFIPAAERYGKMTELDRWVVSHLFESYGQISELLDHPPHFNVNLSGVSLSDETMHDFIFDMFKRYRVPFEAITFEITETAAVTNLQSALGFMERFRQLGCRFALDDFGCGLSSFAYLQNLPVDYLKIDGSFVVDIDTNEVNRAMVDAINQIGHVMGIKTVCEFVENDAIISELRRMGVDYAQGYHVGKPRPLTSL